MFPLPPSFREIWKFGECGLTKKTIWRWKLRKPLKKQVENATALDVNTIRTLSFNDNLSLFNKNQFSFDSHFRFIVNSI